MLGYKAAKVAVANKRKRKKAPVQQISRPSNSVEVEEVLLLKRNRAEVAPTRASHVIICLERSSLGMSVQKLAPVFHCLSTSTGAGLSRSRDRCPDL